MISISDSAGAIFSTRRKFRYALWRVWGDRENLVLFICLNPSTADETENDPTLNRCIGFAKSFGYGGLLLGNLFAFRCDISQ